MTKRTSPGDADDEPTTLPPKAGPWTSPRTPSTVTGLTNGIAAGRVADLLHDELESRSPTRPTPTGSTVSDNDTEGDGADHRGGEQRQLHGGGTSTVHRGRHLLHDRWDRRAGRPTKRTSPCHTVATADSYNGIAAGSVNDNSITDNRHRRGHRLQTTIVEAPSPRRTAQEVTVTAGQDGDADDEADVTVPPVTVSGHAGTDASLDKTTLTFSTTNWSTAQEVTVTASRTDRGHPHRWTRPR